MQVLFFLRKNVNNENGTIYCRITVNGIRCSPFSTYIKTQKKLWNADSQVIIGNSSESQIDNETLRQIRLTIKEIYNEFLSLGRSISAEILKREYVLRAGSSTTFLGLMDTLIHRKIEEKKTAGTIRKLRAWQSKVTSFFVEQKMLFLTPELFSPKVGQYLYEWLLDHKSGKTHASKIMTWCKEVLDYAVRTELIATNTIRTMKFEMGEHKQTPILEWKELEQLEVYSFSSARLGQVRDLFIFNAFTGMSYVDYRNFNPNESIVTDEKGKEWIHYVREKPVTECEAIVPFFPRAKKILEKYRYHLPQISNQKYNAYLKEIADIMGLRVKLTTRVARTTAGQLWLDAGVPLPTVSKMLGHTNIRTTQIHYAKIRRSRIGLDWESINHPAFM